METLALSQQNERKTEGVFLPYTNHDKPRRQRGFVVYKPSIFIK